MADVTHVQQFGNQMAVLFDDGSRQLAYPTVGGLWVIAGGGGVIDPPPPTGGLLDYFTIVYGISGDWEDHWTYSRGGTDHAMPNETPIQAPASGTLVNYGNTDGAGLKSILIFDQTYPRKIAASNTLMNGVYRETDAGDAPAASWVIQHLHSQGAEGHYNQGDVVALSNNTGTSTGPHLHHHLLAGTTIDDRRMDFRKFCD